MSFIGKSQTQELSIEDVCLTQTATAIHTHFTLPFKMKLKVEKKKFPVNYRLLYIYHLTPLVKVYKENKVKMFIGGFPDSSDSTLASLLLLDGYIKVENYDNLFYDERDLVTFKSGVFLGIKYNFQLQVKHNQQKESFDIKKLDWFVEIAKSWRLTHGNHH
jgi:hypothetical protein